MGRCTSPYFGRRRHANQEIGHLIVGYSGRPLGNFRWLVWAVFPDNADGVLENSALQELQVIPAAVSRK